MPANETERWFEALRQQLAASRQRQLVVLRGSRGWCDETFARLRRLEDGWLVFADRDLGGDRVALAKAPTRLGGEAGLVALDLFDGFNPDLLCIAAGMVNAGGVLLLLSPAVTDWNPRDDRFALWQNGARSPAPRFLEYFMAALETEPSIGLVLEARRELPDLPQLEMLAPTPIEGGATAAQRSALARIEDWLRCGTTGVALISAERGRGKSTALGLLIQDLRRDPDRRVLLCAASRRVAARALALADDVEFMPPDRLLAEYPAADPLIIDEAAMIPQSILRQLCRRYPRLVMATTSGGYEGTGRGFRLRFVAGLPAAQRLELELPEPVRWCAGDRLEAWLDRVMLLDDGATPRVAARDPSDLEYQCHAVRDATASVGLLTEVYRLLCSAHYRTRPSDLRMLMENPDLELVVARDRGTVVGAALLNTEGGLEPGLCAQIHLGRRRPRGHLLAQMLTAQAGLEGFARWRGLRVQRIAVVESCRRRGIGRALLARARDLAQARDLHWLGASFALEPGAAAFWRRVGFELAHVSYAAGKSSGEHSLAVLAPLDTRLEPAIAQLGERIQRYLPIWMTQFLRDLDADASTALLRYSGFRDASDEADLAEIRAFAYGYRGFESVFASLQPWVMAAIARTQAPVDRLLIEKAVQNRAWVQLERELGAAGRRPLERRLRALVADLDKACYHLRPMKDISDPADILDFWFADDVRQRWFDSTSAFDRRLRQNYEDLWRRARRGELDHWRQNAEGCLALAIVLDQFPLNMYRGEAESFATEAQARAVARAALARGFDKELPVERRAFLYMPLMHSEDPADQALSVELFAQPGLEKNLRFARHHREVVEQFGRFPHRNAALGRTSTPAEIEYLNSKQAFKG